MGFNGVVSAGGTWTSEDDHLAQHMEILGPMPAELLQRGRKTPYYFDDDGGLMSEVSVHQVSKLTARSTGSFLRIPDVEYSTLEEIVDGDEGIFKRPDDMSAKDAKWLVGFHRGALALDPYLRKSADELLRHERPQVS